MFSEINPLPNSLSAKSEHTAISVTLEQDHYDVQM